MGNAESSSSNGNPEEEGSLFLGAVIWAALAGTALLARNLYSSSSSDSEREAVLESGGGYGSSSSSSSSSKMKSVLESDGGYGSSRGGSSIYNPCKSAEADSSSWSPPPEGWYKLNTDGSVQLNDKCGIGYVNRESGEELFAKNLSSSSSERKSVLESDGGYGSSRGGSSIYNPCKSAEADSSSWSPPPEGWYKPNTDGSVQLDDKCGIGYVNRESGEELFAGGAKPLAQTDIKPAEAEALIQGKRRKAIEMEVEKILAEMCLKFLAGNVNDKNAEVDSSSWSPPPHGWYKLNTDGSKQHKCGIGYVIRDSSGELISGEAKQLVLKITSAETEAKALIHGMQKAKKMGLKRILAETDLESLATIVNDKNSNPRPRMRPHKKRINKLKVKFVEFEIRYVERGKNQCADYLADLGAKGSTWAYPGQPIPKGLVVLLKKELPGSAMKGTSNDYA